MRVYRDSSIPIEVTLGQIFAISTPSIPSTGYTWEPEYDSTMIKLIEGPKFIPSSSAIGAGGETTFKFQTKQLGETQIKMKYQRSWQTLPPLDTKSFTVHITQ
jgi:inhibitor of cysteine peptidase